jgi:hypothetical protein
LETVEEFGNRDEPAPERSQVPHGCNESRVEISAIPETTGEMRVHDADAAFFSQSIDVSSCQKLSEFANVRPFRAREPAIDIGPIGIEVWKRPGQSAEVDLVEDEIPNVRDVRPTKIGPEQRTVLIMTSVRDSVAIPEPVCGAK